MLLHEIDLLIKLMFCDREAAGEKVDGRTMLLLIYSRLLVGLQGGVQSLISSYNS
jgi:hypothetical protein